MKRVLVRVLLAVAVVFGAWGIFSAVSNMAHGHEYAAHAVIDFHQRFSDSKFDEIYSEASSALRASTTKEDYLKLFQELHQKLGAYQSGSGKEKSMKVTYNFGKVSVYVIYESQYEKGPVTEWFRFVISGGRAVLVTYHINSHVLKLTPGSP